MTRAEMLALLREARTEGEFNDWPELDKAIAWLEDEKNITNGGCCNVDGWLLEDGR